MPRPAALRALAATVSAAALSACAVAPPMTEQEQAVAQAVDVNQYLPASREMRDNIETQELFAQAAFWSHEYDLNPSDLESAIKLAAAVRKLGNASRAVEITQTSRAIHPRDPYLLAENAAALIADQRALDAVPVLDQGLRIAPQYARLWSLKGAALDQMEDYGPARQHYQRALSITPHDPNILANMGLSFALAGDPATAETWLRRAVALPGAGAGVRQNLALVLQLQGKTEAGEAMARSARLSQPPRQMPAPPVPVNTPRLPAQATPQQPGMALSGAVGASGPAARMSVQTRSGQAYTSAADAARQVAMDRQRQQRGMAAAPQPLPSAQEMNGEQRDVLAQIARGVGPRRAAPAPAPHVVGPPLQQTPAPQPGYAPQGYVPQGYPAQGYTPPAASAPQAPQRSRGAARRRR